ncbi:hypothetical protein DENIS_0083 [Desulfonema ishimotonii]|uniref:Uncharacterized protein n=1 Tax=Desulfonema ishimotonii TaxID=45657 RepID=A0A401FQ95_9BACT|nr:hypothetical protein [Desulfonema ishimotonii]GBC59147.1 hypothetical protein DENIS_0083 [Desulfonema ishimotonii]
MGPIYAWYPLLGDLRTRGAGYAPIAIFLCNRAGVKPFLLPVMISCFGWPYVLILTTLGIFGAFAIGCILSALMPESPPSLSE